ncbi:hypothetical protein [Actinomadura macrotermitis]|uniref:Uncharacterized protein n=1 Tax=Actinomadura macrotermitis TaxID=2585200 RepID=A0A7K0C245_9ACTN|nr:hypothetical protein [Actinomadura macrotermitis]MQY07162.1 hypothetical protein [Actinomadura macrotermitis]
MTNLPQATARLDAALAGLAVTFRGMTAHPDEYNCVCHWGSAEEPALLKTPDVELAPDLLRRTWETTDWDHQALVLRRILPQCARALVSGHLPSDDAGRYIALGEWRQWPASQVHLAEAVEQWEYDLLVDELPWENWEYQRTDEERCIELTAWLLRHASPRLRVHGVPEERLQRIRLFGVPVPTRWDDPHWPYQADD